MITQVVSIEFKKNKIIINLKLAGIPEYTRDLPRTLSVLKKELPSIFENKCFNAKHQSFYEEVKNTETAHLFEHLILEEMCLTKIENCDSASFNGRTYWDRFAMDRCYQIHLNVPLVDRPIFLSALTKSVDLVNKITRAQIIN